MANPDINWGWAFLEGVRADLIEDNVWPEVVDVIECLLTRENRVYSEKLLAGITRAGATPHGRDQLLDAVLRGLMVVQSDEFRGAQRARDRLETLNDNIAVKMQDLADAIERRDKVSHEHDLHAPEGQLSWTPEFGQGAK